MIPAISLIWSNEKIQLTGKKPVVVLVDTLRASSTIAVALSQGAASVIPAKEMVQAAVLKKNLPDAVLAGENGGKKIRGWDAGNSPYYMKRYVYDNSHIILLTSNTTRVLDTFANTGAELITASFVNARRTIDYLVEEGFDEIIFVCVGTYRLHNQTLPRPKRTYEDFFGAAYMIRLLEEEFRIKVPQINGHRTLLNTPELLLEKLHHTFYAQYLLSLNPKTHNDITISFAIDSYPVVCRLFNEKVRYFATKPYKF